MAVVKYVAWSVMDTTSSKVKTFEERADEYGMEPGILAYILLNKTSMASNELLFARISMKTFH